MQPIGFRCRETETKESPESQIEEPHLKLSMKRILELISPLDDASLRETCYSDLEWFGTILDRERLDVYNKVAFGSSSWVKHLGEEAVADEDRYWEIQGLPLHIARMLKEPCRIFTGKLVGETHMLLRISKSLCGGISINSMGEFLKRRFPTFAKGYKGIFEDIVREYGDRSVDKSYWLLVLRQPLPGSKGKTDVEQREMVKALGEGLEVAYRLPRLIEMIASLFAQYLEQSGPVLRDEYCLVDERMVASGQENRIVVGCGSSEGVYVTRTPEQAFKLISVCPVVEVNYQGVMR